MTLQELSVEYRAHARALDFRICQLQAVLDRTEDEEERCLLAERIRMLSTMFREARELAVLTERYYERGYRRNVKYTQIHDIGAASCTPRTWPSTPGRCRRTTAGRSAASDTT